jgi:flagellar biosynthesis/type III secretory pathway M-ring protein FliF/YscJ
VITGRSDTPDLVAATVTDIAFAVIIVLATIVILIPFIGVALVVRDVIRQMRTERRNAVERADAQDAAATGEGGAVTSGDESVGRSPPQGQRARGGGVMSQRSGSDAVPGPGGRSARREQH